ncbi:sugar O-acetyltransferase [Clostridium sp. MCC353]|uniref:sugar O-acetyltransferase n=1 Tax=Clostridium sp. MCC353 TaxID=2592646 RepID=UPI001C0217C1|nr:sugar O-acetyltransferase [Clostridium sp. MCC353]MBT9778804.1 sugar O-acetyltransferase [Clostridium sp. MCC353]
MNQKERMLAGLPYKAWEDGLEKERMDNKLRIYEYNNTCPDDADKLSAMMKKILGKTGEQVYIEPPFRCDYGYNIEVGENFYANYNVVILDVAKVTIGKNVMFAPNVAVYTAGHPIHHEPRNMGYEYGIPVTIGDNVWIGGNTVINPGVTIGSNVVIGSGSVVTKDIPDNVIAAGNPCRVIRAITDDDKKYYYKDKEFDMDDYDL